MIQYFLNSPLMGKIAIQGISNLDRVRLTGRFSWGRPPLPRYWFITGRSKPMDFSLVALGAKKPAAKEKAAVDKTAKAKIAAVEQAA